MARRVGRFRPTVAFWLAERALWNHDRPPLPQVGRVECRVGAGEDRPVQRFTRLSWCSGSALARTGSGPTTFRFRLTPLLTPDVARLELDARLGSRPINRAYAPVWLQHEATAVTPNAINRRDPANPTRCARSVAYLDGISTRSTPIARLILPGAHRPARGTPRARNACRHDRRLSNPLLAFLHPTFEETTDEVASICSIAASRPA